jgi:predicted amidohydrolase YtcJ
MNRVLSAFVFCVAASVAFAEPSLIIAGAKVFTGDPKAPFAEAVAIEGNTIAAVGKDAEIRAMAGPSTRVVEGAGRLVIPGINDAHTHPGMALPRFEFHSDLESAWPAVAIALKSALEETPADMWLHATVGPAVINDASVTRETLDKIAPGRKVIVAAFTGHGTVASSAAMKALGIADDAKDPEGGWYLRDASGKLNGRMHEYTEYALDRRLADMATTEEIADHIRAFSDEAVSYGITTVQAMPTPSESRFLEAMKIANAPLRLRVMSFPIGERAPTKEGAAVKYILDGTPVEGGAALRTAKYRGGGQGRENFKDFTPFVKSAADRKQQLLVHAAGDKAVATALNAVAKTTLERPRIEHGDGMQSDLFPLAKKTGAIVVLNPTHFPFRAFYPQGEYMLAASLAKAGIPIAIGSDGPLNPYLNILMASARQDNPAESLTREEALRAYTSGSAYAEFAETKKGKIAPGMLADLAMLSQNILEVEPPLLPDTTSVLTIIDGKVVYEQ